MFGQFYGLQEWRPVEKTKTRQCNAYNVSVIDTTVIVMLQLFGIPRDAQIRAKVIYVTKDDCFCLM